MAASNTYQTALLNVLMNSGAGNGATGNATASPAALMYETHNSFDAAQARLAEPQAQGRLGYISPSWPNGTYELRHWAP